MFARADLGSNCSVRPPLRSSSAVHFCLIGAIFVALGLPPGAARAQLRVPDAHHARSVAIDPRAMDLLDRMANAYAGLSQISQRTEYRATLIPLASDGSPMLPSVAPASDGSVSASDDPLVRRSRLVYMRPNLLRVEDYELGRGGGSVQRVCDGKTLWTYRSDKNWYTRDAAPHRLQDFARSARFSVDSFDMLLMLGFKPFKEIASQVDSVRCGEAENVSGVPSDTVVLRSESPGTSSEIRFNIGQEDGLLHRLTVETTTLPPQGGRARGNDELDKLADRNNPEPAGNMAPGDRRQVGMRTIFRCDNIFDEHPTFDALTFAFTIPSGAMLQEPFDPTGKRARQKLEDQIAEILARMGRSRPAKIHRLSF